MRVSFCLFWALVVASLGAGCILREPGFKFDADLAHYDNLMDSTAYPELNAKEVGGPTEPILPRTIRAGALSDSYWDMSLEEAIQIAVTHSPVMRDLGATLIRSPANARTIHEPAIASSNPRTGMEAALSAFDASLSSSLFFENNDRLLNNFFSAGGTNALRQHLTMFETQLTKQTAAGTQLFLRGNVMYDRNNAKGNKFAQAYDSIIESEVRHPLFQGAGTTFNRIAGPNAVPGLINGIMVARLRTDVSIVDFRIALRDLVSNVENAYWDLYYAYRNLDARVQSRNRGLETWQIVNNKTLAGQRGFDTAREAQFREQYYRYQEEVQNALTGRLLDATTTFDGSSGGTFRGIGGVHVCERRLRLLLGLEINDVNLVRPADEPTIGQVSFDWSQVLAEAITRRSELRRQRLQVRHRELELVASRNFLLPRFDLVGRYRWRGLGRNWLGNVDDPAANDPFHYSSLDNLFRGDYQEWQLGGELTFPVGFRRAHAAVRHAQLQLARERTVLDEQQRQVLHDLSNAIGDMDRAYAISQTNYNRRISARQRFNILWARLSEGELEVNFDQLIDAERRYADADVQYYRSLIEYMIAVKNVHYEKGSLLEYCLVQLAEPEGVGDDYSIQARRTCRPKYQLLNYAINKPSSEEAIADEERAAPQDEFALVSESESPLPNVSEAVRPQGEFILASEPDNPAPNVTQAVLQLPPPPSELPLPSSGADWEHPLLPSTATVTGEGLVGEQASGTVVTATHEVAPAATTEPETPVVRDSTGPPQANWPRDNASQPGASSSRSREQQSWPSEDQSCPENDAPWPRKAPSWPQSNAPWPRPRESQPWPRSDESPLPSTWPMTSDGQTASGTGSASPAAVWGSLGEKVQDVRQTSPDVPAAPVQSPAPEMYQFEQSALRPLPPAP